MSALDLSAAIQAAGNALHDRKCSDRRCDRSYWYEFDRDADTAVRAAAPLIEAQIRADERERIAKAIETYASNFEEWDMADFLHAAQIARTVPEDGAS